MTPRAGIAVAGAGALVAVAGAIGVGGDRLAGAHGVHRVPGLIVSTLLIAVGVLVLTRVRSGPIAVAGATAEAVGIPSLVFFSSVDSGSFPPFSLATVLFVSAA